MRNKVVKALRRRAKKSTMDMLGSEDKEAIKRVVRAGKKAHNNLPWNERYTGGNL